nr:hypothetical protein [Tanacetum cinerariifolium]
RGLFGPIGGSGGNFEGGGGNVEGGSSNDGSCGGNDGRGGSMDTRGGGLLESQRKYEERWKVLRKGVQRGPSLWLGVKSVWMVELVLMEERVVEIHLELMEEPFGSQSEEIEFDTEGMLDED